MHKNILFENENQSDIGETYFSCLASLERIRRLCSGNAAWLPLSSPFSWAARSAPAWRPLEPSAFRHLATLPRQLWRPGAPFDWN